MPKFSTLQTCRFWAVVILTVVLVLMPALFFCRWMFPTATPDLSSENDYWTAAFVFMFAVAVPAVAFIFANTKLSSFTLAGKQTIKRPLAWLALVVLFVACVYILAATIILFFWATKEHTDYVSGLGKVTKVIRYPIDEAMNLICSFFGPLITFALSMDVLSLPLPDKPHSNTRK